jgi:hypothetical protein
VIGTPCLNTFTGRPQSLWACCICTSNVKSERSNQIRDKIIRRSALQPGANRARVVLTLPCRETSRQLAATCGGRPGRARSCRRRRRGRCLRHAKLISRLMQRCVSNPDTSSHQRVCRQLLDARAGWHPGAASRCLGRRPRTTATQNLQPDWPAGRALLCARLQTPVRRRAGALGSARSEKLNACSPLLAAARRCCLVWSVCRRDRHPHHLVPLSDSLVRQGNQHACAPDAFISKT